MPVSTSASGIFGVTTVANGISLLSQHCDCVLTNQQIARSCHHHRIDDDIFQAMLCDFPRHRVDNCGVSEHAGFHGMGADVIDDRVDLCRHELGLSARTAVTPTVFCAVIAVIAEVP